MKFLFPFALIAIIALNSCQKDSKDATILRNCTGTYLKVDGKILRVCNHEKVSKYTDGITVKVNYKNIDSCNSNQQVCTLHFEHEGHIKITYLY